MNKIDQLAKALKDSAEIKEKKKTSPYDTNAKVVRVDGNTAWVAIDGGVPQTPATMVVNAKEGDNVRVRVGGGKAYVTGNATAPPTDDRHVLYITKEAVDYIAALKDKDVTVRTITAAAGYIDDLHAKSITTEDLKATTGYIKDLTSENITAKDITADHATIDTLDSTYATIHELHSDYAEIDLANVNNAWINNGVIKDAAISDAQIVGVSANKLTAGTIDAGKINVANLRAKNLIVEKLNGQPVFGGLTTVNPNSSGYKQKNPSQEGWYEYVNAQFVLSTDTTVDDDKVYYKDDEKVALYDQTYIDGLARGLNERIDGAVETFTGDAVPTLINYPAVDWTEAQMASHVGDIYYVINAGQSTDGYCYRFAYDNQTETYEWILIKDSDVTAALQRLVTAEGDISGLKTFETNTESWITDTDEELGSLKTRTTTLETNMGDKVDKTTFNEVKQTVDENSAVITDLTEWQAVTPDGQTTTGYKNIVNKVNQTATTNKSSISSLETTVGDSGTGLVKKTSDIEQTVNGISTKVTAIEGWEIGGRNYCTESAKQGDGTTSGITYTYEGNGVWHANGTATAAGSRALYLIINKFPNLGYGDTYTISMKIIDGQFPSSAHMYVNFSPSSGTTNVKSIIGDNGATILTFECDADKRIRYIGLYFANDTTVDFTFKMKLEKGSKATDWTPALEDTDAEISALESSITQTADKISLVVKSGTSASNLELTDAAINAVADNMVIKSSTDNSKTVIQGGKLYADQIEIGSLAGKIGGRNLVLGAGETLTKTVASGTNKNIPLYDFSESAFGEGRLLYINSDGYATVNEAVVSFDWETNDTTGTFRLTCNGTPWTNFSPIITVSSTNQSGHVEFKRSVYESTYTAIGTTGVRIRTDNMTAGKTITISNLKIELGSKATDWTPAPEDGSAVNLVPWPYYIVNRYGNSYISNGITWTVNLDGSITATGTATADSWYYLAMEYHPEYVNGEYCLPTGTYTLSGCPSEGSSTTCRLNIVVYTTPNTSEGSNSYTDYGDGITFTSTSAQKYARIRMCVVSGCTCPSGGYTFYPMLEVGGIKHSFVSPRINEGAASTATSYITRINDAGIRIHPSSTENNSVVINAEGMEIFKGGTGSANSVAKYGDTARIGKTTSGHTNISSSGMTVYGSDGSVELANIGYGSGNSHSGTALAPYYTIGKRSSANVGNYSVVAGEDCQATAFASFAEGTDTYALGVASHAEGVNTVASGNYSHASNYYTRAEGDYQTAIGRYNVADTTSLFIIGNGANAGSRKNVVVVTDTGDLYLKGDIYVNSNNACTSGTKANSGIDIASHITFGSAWTQQVKVARRIGNMVFFQLEANAGSFNANTNYVLANIASDYRPAVQQFATGITTDVSYNPKGTVSAVLNTDGSINIRTQTASSSGAFVFVSGFYYMA